MLVCCVILYLFLSLLLKIKKIKKTKRNIQENTSIKIESIYSLGTVMSAIRITHHSYFNGNPYHLVYADSEIKRHEFYKRLIYKISFVIKIDDTMLNKRVKDVKRYDIERSHHLFYLLKLKRKFIHFIYDRFNCIE